MSAIDVHAVVRIHFVIPDAVNEPFNARTHGLEAFGHKEFQLLVPGFCRDTAGHILNDLADAVVNHGETFRSGGFVDVDGAPGRCIEVPGDFRGDPKRLRIVDVPAAYHSPLRCERN